MTPNPLSGLLSGSQWRSLPSSLFQTIHLQMSRSYWEYLRKTCGPWTNQRQEAFVFLWRRWFAHCRWTLSTWCTLKEGLRCFENQWRNVAYSGSNLLYSEILWAVSCYLLYRTCWPPSKLYHDVQPRCYLSTSFVSLPSQTAAKLTHVSPTLTYQKREWWQI